MKSGIILGSLLVAMGAAVFAQSNDSTEISPGFKMRPTGVLDIGDIYAEVNHYDSAWTITQQHDKFTAATTQPSMKMGPDTHMISGTLATAQGPADFMEHVTKIEGGVNWSMVLSSDKPIGTNELSAAFILPTSSFAGKKIKVDDQDVLLPEAAAKQGEARIFEKPTATKVELPTPKGTLTITGSFKFLVQDDREWNDPRYSMRLNFTPGDGQIKQSSIELKIVLKPAN